MTTSYTYLTLRNNTVTQTTHTRHTLDSMSQQQDWKPIPFDSVSRNVESNSNVKKPAKQDSMLVSPITRTAQSGMVNNNVDNNGVTVKRHTSVSFNLPTQNPSQLYHRHSISSKMGVPKQEYIQALAASMLNSDDLKQKGLLDGKTKADPNNKTGSIQIKKKNRSDTQKKDADSLQNKEVSKNDNPDDKKDTAVDDNAAGTDDNCEVHMPGDFVYINPDTSTTTVVTEEKKDKPTKSPRGSVSSATSNKIVFHKDEYTPINITQIDSEEDDSKFHILIGATGSVATIKIPLIIDRLFKIYSHDTISIQLILTKAAEHFLDGLKIHRDVRIWREDDLRSRLWDLNNNFIDTRTCNIKNQMKDDIEPLLFHELSRWADIFLIAPLSANSLAKLANGICNNLLTSVVRDWNTKKTPIVVAPAMNTFMYINPMTKKHLLMLKEDFPTLEILKPVEKVLICGDIGMGGMREWNDIVENIRLKIKDIKRQRHENETDNEDEELEMIGKDLAEEDDDDDDDEDDDDEDESRIEDDDEDDEDDDDETEDYTEDYTEDDEDNKNDVA